MSKWIPAKEKPPCDGWYLVTFKLRGKDALDVDTARYIKETDRWKVYNLDVIAWMELPEPWEGEE